MADTINKTVVLDSEIVRELERLHRAKYGPDQRLLWSPMIARLVIKELSRLGRAQK